MDEKKRIKLKTRVYIDGYNLYYGCLKGTSYKWLDLEKLFQVKIIPSILVKRSGNIVDSVFDNGSTKYFTAKIIESAAKSVDSVSSQAKYHRALVLHLSDRIEIIEGYYALNKMAVRVVDAENPEKLPRECEKIQAWKLEEKQTDVNIAMHAYHDAMHGNVDHAVFVTNDTDISTALEFIKRNTNVIVGLIIPTRDSERSPNKALTNHADWTRSHIKDEELRDSQLPRTLPGKRKSVSKPDSWYPNHEKFLQILELCIMVKGSRSKAFQWLKATNSHFEEKSPLDLIEEGEAECVLHYIRQYITEHTKNILPGNHK